MKADVTKNRLISSIQQEFPLCDRPFAAMADELGTDENSLIEEVKGLKACGVIRRISGSFNLRKFGYHMALAAFDVQPDKLHIAANVLVEQPSVSHCYLRQDRDYALWFTVATRGPADDEIAELAGRCSARRVLNLPATQYFKLSTMFDIETGCVLEAPTVKEKLQPVTLTPELKKIVHALQMGLNIVHRPFDAPAKTAGASPEKLFAGANLLRSGGMLRKYSAVIDHAAAGIIANALVLWQVDEGAVENAGLLAALNPHVSHCYARKTANDWPYNLYTMMHARSQKKLNEAIFDLADALGRPPRRIMPTMHEIKKSPVIVNL